MAKYKVGDKVRIRQWDDMEKEFGLDETGDIKCLCFFIESMKHLCGRTATIKDIRDKKIKLTFDDESGNTNWQYSTDMIEPLEYEFHEFDTVKHSKYGIGTVISIGSFVIKVDFDEWNEDFLFGCNVFWCMSEDLTLIKSYMPF